MYVYANTIRTSFSIFILFPASVPFLLFAREFFLVDADQDFFSERNASLVKGSTLLDFSVALILFVYSFAIVFIIYWEFNFYNIDLGKKYYILSSLFIIAFIFSLSLSLLWYTYKSSKFLKFKKKFSLKVKLI